MIYDGFFYRPLLYIHYPRGKLPQSVPEQMQPSGPMTPVMGRLGTNGSGHGQSQGSGTSSNVSQGDKPSSIRSNRSTTSMASMRSVKSFIGTMFNNLKGGHGGVGPGTGFSHSSPGKHGNGGAYSAGYSHHTHGSTSSIGGTYPGNSRPGSGSSVGLATSSLGGPAGSNLSYNSVSLNGSNVSAEYNATSQSGSGNNNSSNRTASVSASADSSSPSSVTTLTPGLLSGNSSGSTLMPSAVPLVSSPTTSSGTSPILDRAAVAATPSSPEQPPAKFVIRAPGTPGASSPTSAVVSGGVVSQGSNGTSAAPVVVVNVDNVPFSETMDGFP